jgi:hypothetical protein
MSDKDLPTLKASQETGIFKCTLSLLCISFWFDSVQIIPKVFMVAIGFSDSVNTEL